MPMDPRQTLKSLFDAALAAVSAAHVLPAHLPPPPKGRTAVLGFGKAAAEMARVFEEHWPGPLEGFAVTRYGHGAPCRTIEVLEAGHPVPDEAAVAAADRALALASGLGADDLMVCLASGGGSALLAKPAPGIRLEDKQALTRSLLACGAAIDEINCVRKHLSAIKGGRLAAEAAPARVVTLAISDVPGDDPATIASGPTVADPTVASDARAILARYGIGIGPPIAAALSAPAAETPKTLSNARFEIVARARDAIAAAARAVEREGFEATVLGDDLAGEAAELGAAHARLAVEIAEGGNRPVALLSGGETAVTLPRPGFGRGGRNTEYLLALAHGLAGAPGIWALACDTDGIDGTEDSAGALVAPDSLARAAAAGLDARAALAAHDSHGFFHALGDLVVTGPTRTNVNDFRAILIGAGARQELPL